jgi:uncharacterized protein (TIGR03083 family)
VTATALTALPALTALTLDIGHQLDERDWQRPSACPGWSVHDIFIHLTCTLREIAAPDTLPEPVPGSIERTNDAAVIYFRIQPPAKTLEDYQQLIAPALAGLAEMQQQPAASEIVDLDDAGRYPTHLIADSLVFDHYCHLRHDIGGRGPLDLDVPGDEATVQANLAWLIAGLPQMSPPRLIGTVRAPVELRLTGPGGGTWTLDTVDTHLEILAHGERNPAAQITCTADEFILWATHRISWRDASLVIDGDQTLAEQVASAIHVF